MLKADLHATLHCIERSTSTWERGTFTKEENVIYRDPSHIVELLLQLENKQQIMKNNVETQHNRMYSLYIGSLCNVAFPMARFTCIVTSQVFVEIWMRWSITLSSAFYTGRKHLWIVFSFKDWLCLLGFKRVLKKKCKFTRKKYKTYRKMCTFYWKGCKSYRKECSKF